MAESSVGHSPITVADTTTTPLLNNTGQQTPAGFWASMFTPPQVFRKAGAPAGAWPHTPWHVCVFHDPYERVNFWSHFLPGVAFLVIGALALLRHVHGALALSVFCACAATTHLLSALTHVYPDDHYLEKLDHLGIVALIAGTPFTAVMAVDPNGDLSGLAYATAALVGAAFLPPLLRTVSFVGIGTVVFYVYFHIVNTNLLVQVLLYVAGAYCFIRNDGHDRWVGFTDHHFLHYFVTVACFLHVLYIRHALSHPFVDAKPKQQ